MDIENTTPFPTHVLRESVNDIYGMLISVTKVTYLLVDGALVPAREQLPLHLEPCEDAPTGEFYVMRESGVVDVTVVGDVIAPGGQPCRTVDVKLSWGDEIRTLRAFGLRIWRGEKGDIHPSAPEPFVRLPMAWKHAYGGRHIIPAGFAPHSKLPMPSGELAFSANPGGTGFYFEPEQVEGQLLPALEDPENLIRTWRDQPTPICFAILPLTSSLRMDHLVIDPFATGMKSKHNGDETAFARLLQNAHPRLQTKDLLPGTRFCLEGMTANDPMEFTLPVPPARWLVHTGKRTSEHDLELMAVQLRPSESSVTILLGEKVLYPLIKGEERRAKLVPVAEER